MVKIAQQMIAQNGERQELDTPLAGTEPAHNPSVIAGTSEGLWFLGSEQHVELKGHAITALAPSADGLWAVVDHNQLWHRTPDGRWQEAASVLQLNCVLSHNGVVFAGTSAAHLVRVTDGSVEIINSFERAEGRDDWYTPWGGPPDVRSLAVGSSGELYVNVHVGGILRSGNQGQSWQPTLDIHSDVHEVRTVPDCPGLVLAATAEGLATSRDGGTSWHFDQANLHATYSRAVAVCGTIVLMSTSLGPQGGKAAIYRRSLDEPHSFEKCEQGLPEWFSDNINTGCLDALPGKAAFGTSDGQIFISDDAGLTWQRVAAGLPPIRRLRLV